MFSYEYIIRNCLCDRIAQRDFSAVTPINHSVCSKGANALYLSSLPPVIQISYLDIVRGFSHLYTIEFSFSATRLGRLHLDADHFLGDQYEALEHVNPTARMFLRL